MNPLALLDVIKTMASIISSERMSDTVRRQSERVMDMCLQLTETSLGELSKQMSSIEIVKQF